MIIFYKNKEVKLIASDRGLKSVNVIKICYKLLQKQTKKNIFKQSTVVFSGLFEHCFTIT